METPALLLSKDLSLALGTRHVREPAKDEIVVQVDWAGVCGSDIHVLRTGAWVAYWPATLGHEVAGVVTVSKVDRLPVGTRVVLDSRMPVPTPNRLRRASRMDPDLQWLGEACPGGYAGAVLVPAISAHRLPDGLDTADAVLAEPLAVVMCALDQVRTQPTNVLILGYGPVGALAHAEIATRWPTVRIHVVEPSARRAELATAMGATVATDSRRVGGQDLVIDAAGYATSFADAVSAAAHGATVCLIALAHQTSKVLPSDIVERSLTIVGSLGFDTDHLDDAVRRLAANPERYRRIVTHRVRLDEVPELVAKGLDTTLKILIRCQAAAPDDDGSTK